MKKVKSKLEKKIDKFSRNNEGLFVTFCLLTGVPLGVGAVVGVTWLMAFHPMETLIGVGMLFFAFIIYVIVEILKTKVD